MHSHFKCIVVSVLKIILILGSLVLTGMLNHQLFSNHTWKKSHIFLKHHLHSPNFLFLPFMNSLYCFPSFLYYLFFLNVPLILSIIFFSINVSFIRLNMIFIFFVHLYLGTWKIILLVVILEKMILNDKYIKKVI